MLPALKDNLALQERALALLWRLPYETRRTMFRVLSPGTHRRFQAMRRVETERGRSLKPFDDHACLFVHIPKCAGISVSKSLFGNLAGGHLRVPHYQLILSEHDFDRYFKFTFVRNPWDRLVSGFRFLKSGGLNGGDRAWAREHLAPFDDFHDFVARWVDRKNVSTWKHFAPQYKYICEPGGENLKVDFVGYFEHLADDFEHVRAKLGLRAGLEHHNRTSGSREDYRACYSTETRDLVADVYAEDIRLFGYDFETACTRRRAELAHATHA
jgi:hypothetical protein